jgi:uncharacterized membrane protein (DUF2068 family)
MEPLAIDERSSASGLRAVATFEIAKGLVVLALGLGLLTLVHRDVADAVERVLVHLHIDPEHRLGHSILNAASKISDKRLLGLAAGAGIYSTVRFVEGWGLWHRRVWAEWFALLSGALYLPWEIVKVAERSNLLHLTLFFGNLMIFLYMLYIRLRAYTPPECPEPETD